MKKTFLYIVVPITFLVAFLFGQFLGSKNNEVIEVTNNYKKVYDNKELVYTYKLYLPDKLPADINTSEVSSEVPFINLNYDSITSINNEIKNKYNELKDDNIITEQVININSLKYKYYINDNILSLIIEYKNYDYTDDEIQYNYDIYNININDGKVLADNDLITKKNYTFDEVRDNIIKKINNEYETLGYDDYKNTEFYKKTMKLINESNLNLYINSDGNLSLYIDIIIDMGLGKINRNFVLK